ncbi:MAG TPA: recombinase family protein [Devosiaceae bacterium]|jgi:DNA invertase Pin-like site-specific DNA recombinase|nr:recombinase family protein [Devosiaceae bacterium]
MTAAGADKVFTEKRSGLDSRRPELERCLEYVREGDTLLVTKLDRLARSTSDLYRIVSGLSHKAVGFKVLDDAAVDTTTRTGKLVMGILALIAEFETEIRRERQMEGIARAKAEGRTGGRPRLVTDEMQLTMVKLRSGGMSIRGIAGEVGLSKATVQKTLKRVKEQVGPRALQTPIFWRRFRPARGMPAYCSHAAISTDALASATPDTKKITPTHCSNRLPATAP